jgi:hypothetical protein
MHMRGDDRSAYSGGNRVTGKSQRRGQVFGTVIDPGKKMAVKVDHARLEEYPLL